MRYKFLWPQLFQGAGYYVRDILAERTFKKKVLYNLYSPNA